MHVWWRVPASRVRLSIFQEFERQVFARSRCWKLINVSVPSSYRVYLLNKIMISVGLPNAPRHANEHPMQKRHCTKFSNPMKCIRSQRPDYLRDNIFRCIKYPIHAQRILLLLLLLLLLLFLPKTAFLVASAYHTIKHANAMAEMIATTLARATEAGPRASAPQQGRL